MQYRGEVFSHSERTKILFIIYLLYLMFISWLYHIKPSYTIILLLLIILFNKNKWKHFKLFTKFEWISTKKGHKGLSGQTDSVCDGESFIFFFLFCLGKRTPFSCHLDAHNLWDGRLSVTSVMMSSGIRPHIFNYDWYCITFRYTLGWIFFLK